MRPQDHPRLLFVHAHPDDETLTTGATIAHYAARGADVHVVTCTLGEEGEVIGERYAQLAVDHADQLGGFRSGNSPRRCTHSASASRSSSAVPVAGGTPEWRMPRRRTPAIHRRRPGEAVGELVAIIRELRPHVVVTYDPKGGYGHPDHIQAHEVTTAAVAASAEPITPATRGRCPSCTGL